MRRPLGRCHEDFTWSRRYLHARPPRLAASRAELDAMAITLEIYGHCLADRLTIEALARAEDRAGLVSLPGSGYSLAIHTDNDVTLLVGASVAPRNLFYAECGGKLFHGNTILEVVRRARLDWRWNWRALADLSSLEHSVDGETVHADVRKVAAGCVVRFAQGRLTSWQMSWAERVSCPSASADAAVTVLADTCRSHVGQDVVVPMSAGFDSRVVLACLLASGIKPRLITMGSGDGTDARVAAAIARRFGLEFATVPLEVADFFTHAPRIIEITGGSKTFQNWHSYALANNASVTRDTRLFIGANGEAARSYYLNKGIASQAAQTLASERVKRAFWRAKMRPIFTSNEMLLLNPRFAHEFAAQPAAGRVERMVALSSGKLLAGLDRFYTEQRVANFIANGIAMLDASASTVAPMLERAWMAQVWNLPRDWKLDSKWHRFAIARLCPELLEFIEESTGEPMRSEPRPLYWLPIRKATPPAPYVDYGRFLRSAAVQDFVRDSHAEMTPLAKPELLSRVFAPAANGANRVRAGSFLLSMLHLQKHLRREGIRIEVA